VTYESSKKWIIPENISSKDGIVEEILTKRGLNKDEFNDYLNPSLSSIPTWEKLYGANNAAEKIIKAVNENKRIFIHGDFDVDGISATAIMWDFLYREVSDKLGKKVHVLPYIPDRVDEGYGLSKSSVDAMIKEGGNLIVTVDCGVRDRVLIEEYMQNSACEFIVTDHHALPENIEDIKYTLVHQMFPQSEYPEQRISGTFVAFLLTQAIRSQLEIDSELSINSRGLDLVALSTVTDMMPLVGINRTIVKYGLEQIRMGSRYGLKYIMELSGVEIADTDSYHLGFVIGPRLNAAGRIGSAMDALKLLVTKDKMKAREYAAKLHNLNVQRQETTQSIIKEAEQILNIEDTLLFISGEEWHEGIIGLVAGKLMEKYGKPVIVATKTDNGSYKGSARSIASFNITKAVSNFGDYLERYGGHAQAAGFTVKPNELERFKKKLIKYANENISTDVLERTLEIDAIIEPTDVTQDMYGEIDKLKPFGYGNSKPLIMLKGVEINEKYLMKGGEHIKLRLRSGMKDVIALMFNCREDGEKLNEGDTIDIAGSLTENTWNGFRSIEVQVKEWRSTN